MLQKGKFNILVDGQFGSCGKGLMASFLAHHYKPEHVSCLNMPNAGHVAVNEAGIDYLSKALPVCAILREWYNERPTLWIGPTAAFTMARFKEEIRITGTNMDRLCIHPRCGIVTQEHAATEQKETKHVASTMQGCGAMLAEKVLRKKGTLLARDYPGLSCYISAHFEERMHSVLESGGTFLHEGCQGFSLDINHGFDYPHCTSRGTTAMSAAADMGVNYTQIGEVIQVVRPYPIRVGNVVEDGKMVGHSGGWYEDQEETTWEELGEQPEITTVTGRIRRVASFSMIELKRSVRINGATQIALNFANYLDRSCFGINDSTKLTRKIRCFIEAIEEVGGVPVTLVGTGPQIDHVCML